MNIPYIIKFNTCINYYCMGLVSSKNYNLDIKA